VGVSLSLPPASVAQRKLDSLRRSFFRPLPLPLNDRFVPAQSYGSTDGLARRDFSQLPVRHAAGQECSSWRHCNDTHHPQFSSNIYLLLALKLDPLELSRALEPTYIKHSGTLYLAFRKNLSLNHALSVSPPIQLYNPVPLEDVTCLTSTSLSTP
jgi:hypothetical protein